MLIASFGVRAMSRNIVISPERTDGERDQPSVLGESSDHGRSDSRAESTAHDGVEVNIARSSLGDGDDRRGIIAACDQVGLEFWCR
jgi:hypothetical protein